MQVKSQALLCSVLDEGECSVSPTWLSFSPVGPEKYCGYVCAEQRTPNDTDSNQSVIFLTQLFTVFREILRKQNHFRSSIFTINIETTTLGKVVHIFRENKMNFVYVKKSNVEEKHGVHLEVKVKSQTKRNT